MINIWQTGFVVLGSKSCNVKNSFLLFLHCILNVLSDLRHLQKLQQPKFSSHFFQEILRYCQGSVWNSEANFMLVMSMNAWNACRRLLSAAAIVREWRWRKESARDKKRVVPEVLAAYCKKTFWAVVYASKKEDTKLDSFFVPTIQMTPFITLSILAMYLHTKWVFRILHCFKP